MDFGTPCYHNFNNRARENLLSPEEFRSAGMVFDKIISYGANEIADVVQAYYHRALCEFREDWKKSKMMPGTHVAAVIQSSKGMSRPGIIVIGSYHIKFVIILLDGVTNLEKALAYVVA
jgi:hypothetical protein